MKDLGQLCLLLAFFSSGCAAITSLLRPSSRTDRLQQASLFAACTSLAALTAVIGILAWALYQRDFSFEYVAKYSSRHLPWYYSLSALWVGQAGSLVLWAWLLAAVALVFRFRPGSDRSQAATRIAPDDDAPHLRSTAFGVLMGYLCFLISILVFAADPMTASVTSPGEGKGLSPLLQHPAMLIHPPVVFFGYTLWTVPFALAAAALINGRSNAGWLQQARPWALLAWTVLGAGILLGAQWAYEELGWGGYWGWDPVENGSLMPWLTGSALIHAMMAWQYRGVLKKTAVALAMLTFGLCNFATFLTRSGIFSSLHAFSQSPIGWLFLGLMILLIVAGTGLLVRRRSMLVADRPLGAVFSRESMIVLAIVALLSLTAVVIGGTLSSAITSAITGKTIFVGPGFYNAVLAPTGVVILLATAMAPLLRWGQHPTSPQRVGLQISAAVGCAATIVAVAVTNHPLYLLVIGTSVFAVSVLCGCVVLDARRWQSGSWPVRLWHTIGRGRRQYAGFLIHLGFMCLALGITGSSLGKHEQDFTLRAGQTVEWSGRQVRYIESRRSERIDKEIVEAELEVDSAGRTTRLLPARHFHRLNQSWTTEVAIASTWRGDIVAILHTSEPTGKVHITLVDNPMMRWIWLGGWIAGLGTLVRLCPGRRRAADAVRVKPQPASHQSHEQQPGRRAAA